MIPAFRPAVPPVVDVVDGLSLYRRHMTCVYSLISSAVTFEALSPE
jgi:hypothetical protein